MIVETLRDLEIGYHAGEGGMGTEGPVLVMIHGAGGRAQFWQNQVRFLDGSVNALALDLPGHGASRGEGEERIEDYATWLAGVLERISVGPVFLMGHSMGGAIAQEMAVSHPELLGGIILVATGARLSVAPPFLDGLQDRFEETVDTIIRYSYGPEAGEAMVKLGAKFMKEAGSQVVYGDFLACDRFDRRQDLKQIDLPCLILCGEEDKLTPPDLSEEIHEKISGSILKRIPSAGHMVMIEKYQDVNQQVQEFLRTNHH
jgi:pimeloyl-ACP methyl ester carboxylesterase